MFSNIKDKLQNFKLSSTKSLIEEFTKSIGRLEPKGIGLLLGLATEQRHKLEHYFLEKQHVDIALLDPINVLNFDFDILSKIVEFIEVQSNCKNQAAVVAGNVWLYTLFSCVLPQLRPDGKALWNKLMLGSPYVEQACANEKFNIEGYLMVPIGLETGRPRNMEFNRTITFHEAQLAQSFADEICGMKSDELAIWIESTALIRNKINSNPAIDMMNPKNALEQFPFLIEHLERMEYKMKEKGYRPECGFGIKIWKYTLNASRTEESKVHLIRIWNEFRRGLPSVMPSTLAMAEFLKHDLHESQAAIEGYDKIPVGFETNQL